MTLMTRKKEQRMKNSSWLQHKAFLAYWEETQSKPDYVHKKPKKN